MYSDGGGIHNNHGTLTLTNSTVSGNSATGSFSRGGGIYSSFGTLTLNNTIVALNNAPTDADISGSFTENSSLVGVNPGFVRDPSAGVDGVWGTPDDDYGDLRLLSTSSAINTGDNALLPADEFDLDGDSNTTEPLPVDLAGNQRVRYTTVDMGAYEYAMPGDADDDTDVDGADLAMWQRNYDPAGFNDNTFEMADFDSDGDVDGADLAIWQGNYDPVGLGGTNQLLTSESEPIVMEAEASVGGVTYEASSSSSGQPEVTSTVTQKLSGQTEALPTITVLGVWQEIPVNSDYQVTATDFAIATTRARGQKRLAWRDDGFVDVLTLPRLAVQLDMR